MEFGLQERMWKLEVLFQGKSQLDMILKVRPFTIVSAGYTTNAEVLRSNEILVHIVMEQVVPQLSCRQVSSQLLILVTPEEDSGVT